jgi:exodeoxyribonuclease VIII
VGDRLQEIAMARIVTHQPFPDYLAEADVNASALRAGRRSMLHMAAAIEGQSKEPTAALRIGSALHCAVLEPMRFEAVATVAPAVDRRTKEGKATYAAWQAALPADAMVLDADEFETVRQASAALLASKFPGRIGTGEAEVSIYWDETVTVDREEVVVGCKARLDWLGVVNDRPIIADIKTTRDATPRAFARACATYGYVHQMAWYRRAVRALQQDDQFQHGRCDVLLGAVETDAPHAVGIYTLFEADLNCADAENMETLESWARCILTGEIAGPCDDVTALAMPDWTFQYQRQKQLRQQVGDIIDGVDDFDATIPF